MASSNPVPSRAALHALRGVLFTTSCSVAFLAEERRRRLKLARTAVEHGRMLHLISRCPIPVAPVESRQEKTPQSTFSNSTWTRRRRVSRIRPSAPDCTAGSDASAAVTSAAAAEATFLAEPLLRVLADLQSRASQLLSSATPTFTGAKTAHSYTAGDPKLPVLHAVPSLVNTCGSARSGISLQNGTLASVKLRRYADADSAIIGELSSRQVANADKPETAPFSPEVVRFVRAFYDETVSLLRRLLPDLALPRSEVEILERLHLATEILAKLAHFGAPVGIVGEPLAGPGLSLLRVALDRDQDAATVIVRSLLRLCNSRHRIFTVLADFMHGGGSSTHMEQALDFICDSTEQRPWLREVNLHRILACGGSWREGFPKTKRLYGALQKAGLYQRLDIDAAAECRIRASMALKAIDQGDEELFRTEMLAYQSKAPDGVEHDVRFQHLLLAKEATLGKWDAVFGRIDKVWHGVDTTAGRTSFQAAVAHVTNIFLRDQAADNVETFVRNMVAKYRIKVERDWVMGVFEKHASQRQAASAFSWLQFCCDNGVLLDAALIRDVHSECCKSWCFPATSGRELWKRLMAIDILPPHTRGHRGKREHGLGRPTAASRKGGSEAEDGSSAGSELRSAVVEVLDEGSEGVTKAQHLIQTARSQGVDVSQALTPLILARFKSGDEPRQVMSEALRMGVKIHDSAFNIASQVLALNGDFPASIAMCRTGARANGQGDGAYDAYSFSNLVYAYTGSGKYDSLVKLLCRFTSEARLWHGCRVSEECIKLAMKTVAMRVVVYTNEEGRHRKALNWLEKALVHVHRFRASANDRRMVADRLVAVAEAASRRKREDGKPDMGETRGGAAEDGDGCGVPADDMSGQLCAAGEAG